MMALRNLALLAVSVVTSLVLLGCSKSGEGQAAPDAAPSASAAVAPAPASTLPEKRRGPERGPGHGGVDSILFRAARDLPFRDDQKAKLAALQDKLRDRETDPRDAMNAFATDLAAQVRAGKVDAAKLQPDEAALDAAMGKMLDKQAAALTGIHDTLDAGQRKALVDAVHARAAARDASDAGATAWTARKLDQLTSELGLGADPAQQVKALLAKQTGDDADRETMKAEIESILTAFEADTFDATAALKPTLAAPHAVLDRQIALTSQLMPLLRPDQREKLAVSTMKPPPRGGWGGWPPGDDGHGGGGGGGGGAGGNE
jgi:hypothetical protein